MNMASPEIQNLARHLVAFEAPRDNASEAHEDVAVEVIAELRLRLIRLAGVDGFRSLLSRALAMAKAQSPSLHLAHVRADGSLEGFDGIEQSGETRATEQAGILLVACLLELMVTFIGEPLTLRLVRDGWPNASLDGADLRSEEQA